MLIRLARSILLNALIAAVALTALPARTAAQHLPDLDAFGGSVAYVVERDGATIAQRNADEPLAVASAFKLSVLAALRNEIDGRRRSWSDVVALDPSWKSLPSGILQDWPDGSFVTLQTLSTLMISLSDNTAADALIAVLGRETIEPYAFDNIPLLTTREVLTLKSAGAASLRRRWRKSGIPQRRAMLSAIDAVPIGAIMEAGVQPADLDVEWHYGTRQLCALMRDVADLPLMSVEPGPAVPGDWLRVAYKGGSDAGVVNMTSVLTARDGTTYCVSATANDLRGTIDANAFRNAYARVIASLAHGS